MTKEVEISISALLWAPEGELADKIRQFFVMQNSPLSEVSHVYVSQAEQALEKTDVFSGSKGRFNVAVLAVEELDDEVESLIRRLSAKQKLAVVVVSGDEKALSVCAECGVHFTLPPNGLDGNILYRFLISAIESCNLMGQAQQQNEQNITEAQGFGDVAHLFAEWAWEVDRDLNILQSSSKKDFLQEVPAGAGFTSFFAPDEMSRIEEDFHHFFKIAQPFEGKEYRGADIHGKRPCWRLSGVPVFNEMDEVVGFRGIGKEVSSEKATSDALYRLSNHDQLTGLNNRFRFLEEVERLAKGCTRTGKQGSLAVINVNRFRHINDAYGLEIGDKLIAHIAQVLKDTMRMNDFLARIGPDEFGILLPDMEEGDAEVRMERILSTLHGRPLIQDGREIYVTCGAGVIYFPSMGTTADELVNKANVALELAKRNGQGGYSVFDEVQLRNYDTSRRLKMVDFITRSLESGEDSLVLHFQPIVALNGTEVMERYEVLVRLVDEVQGLVTPVNFIELAEEYGLVGRIDELVTKRTLKRLSRWQKEGRDVTVSINMSGCTFENDEALQAIEEALKSATFKPGTVIFEITETSRVENIDSIKNVISRFRKLGAHFALDDCGRGYASFSYIRELDLDYIKIDGDFVRDLHRNKEDEAFVRALRDVARRMNIKTIAEMVEQEETVEHLRRLGIDYAQGYLFAMPEAELPQSFSDIQNKVFH